jgi:glycosyltransferase involved in cell wall biosynthesis
MIFSIVIPTFNRPDILKKTLDCLEKQDCSFSYEVIVVDDCSAIPLHELGFGEGKRANWKLLRNEENLGRAATRNRGIRESRGEYILMIDDDIWASPGLLQAHYQTQKRISGGVVIGAIPPAKEVDDIVWNRYIKRRFDRIHFRLQDVDLDYGLFLTGNVSTPTGVIKDLAGFDERFKDYSFEDTDMGYRLHKAGVRFSHAPEAIGYHMFSENLESLCQKAYQMGRSSYIFVKMHPNESRAIQYHSITIGPWNGREALKNIIRIMIFNKFARAILKDITFVAASLKLETLVFAVMPWVELQHIAQGANEDKSARRS